MVFDRKLMINKPMKNIQFVNWLPLTPAIGTRRGELLLRSLSFWW